MTGVVTLVKAKVGFIRSASGTSYAFTRADGDGLRPGDRVEFSPDGPRFGRWRAHNVQAMTGVTVADRNATTTKGATA